MFWIEIDYFVEADDSVLPTSEIVKRTRFVKLYIHIAWIEIDRDVLLR